MELGQLAADDHLRWWSAVVVQDPFATQPAFGALSALDHWWQGTRARPIDAPRVPALGAPARRLLDLLALARQALTPAQLSALGSRASVDELVAAGVASRDAQGAVVALDGVEPGRPAVVDTRALIELLAESARDGADGLGASDGWACMRAAELAAELGDHEHAERLALRAVTATSDGSAREDLWRRWETVLDGLKAPEDRDRLVACLARAAEHALALGDGDRADRMARSAMRLAGDSFAVLLLHGRTSHGRGDVTTAAMSISRALNVAANAAERARAAGLMAQVRYLAGDPKQAEKFARDAIEHAADVVTRLEGSNVLGKLLLGREAWREAEEHFARDAYDAAAAGAHEEELRARLNRGIAVLYMGRREQAREMLEEVLEDGERQGILRAVAYTLSNLATIAIFEHRYEHALDLSERAIEVRRRIGGRVGLVQPITNLAELRLRLGLVDEAEQSLRFGLHACGQGLPLSRHAFFAKLAATIHLERGDTALAARELTTALSGATASGDLAQVAQCHRIAARIALEDGDLARARSAIAAADELKHTSFGRAELELLRGEISRAAGEPFFEVARQALVLAQQADDPESLREAHVLLGRAYLLAGDAASATSHLESARGVVERIAETLPTELSSRYLRRTAVRAVDDLALELGDQLEALGELDRSAAPVTVRSQPLPTPHGGSTPSDTARAGDKRRLVGDSAALRALRGAVLRVAKAPTTVLIHGETGTGKELVAEAIHRASPRAHGPLVKVNCAALVETLLLSELFGHEKGAFTGASTRRRGRFEVAEGGTLFLDEIGDISPRTQVALLRVLQDGTYERVGGCTQLRANVRIVCATHRDLRAMVARGEFREDLYYRLCGVVLEVPSLRERTSDLPALSQALLQRAEETAGVEPRPISDEAMAALCRHSWPGNVRELENALRVAALFARGDRIELSDFTENVEGLRHLASTPDGQTGRVSDWGTVPPPPRDSTPDSVAPPSSSTDVVYAEVRGGLKLSEMKKKLEQECIYRALVESGGNITKAADLLGMKRPRLSQLVKQYELATVLEDIKP